MGAKLIDIMGQRFGILQVIGIQKSERRALWICKCECGEEALAQGADLRGGRIVSCGCLKRQRSASLKFRHGSRAGATTSEYRSWCHAKSRCMNPADRDFASYGGRGIKMSDEWVADFVSFLRDMGPCPPGLTLERKDVDGPYADGNCVWASRKEQSRNRRSVRQIQFNGEMRCYSEIAEASGVDADMLRRLVTRKSMSAEAAVAYLKNAPE